ncbi:hypothetical protein E8E13_001244 [Curvularia kusanoi]|uniref:AB hydrolase-1 domain-containing protein n=1 Tax=Curvularia kusanoi TaxID=90978 RepID=A0A9P4T634_CURKU|nr:hypothetical protein E8E13_001244 [Curvularia kusanoi]
MSATGTSLSRSRSSGQSRSTWLDLYLGLSQAPHSTKPCVVKPMCIDVDDEPGGGVPGFLHLPPTASLAPTLNTAAILLSGAGGGIAGPSSIYLSLADKLATLKHPVPTLRLDYRYPARNKYCVNDVLSAMDELESSYEIKRFVLVGWSFGGAPVLTVGGSDDRVAGCVTVACQTAETEGIRSLSPKPLLLLHGTGDRTLSHSCSESLYARYGEDGDRQIHLFPDDDHALTRSSLEAEQLIGSFILKCAGIKADHGDNRALAEKLIGDDEKVRLMVRGGDLRRNESAE